MALAGKLCDPQSHVSNFACSYALNLLFHHRRGSISTKLWGDDIWAMERDIPVSSPISSGSCTSAPSLRLPLLRRRSGDWRLAAALHNGLALSSCHLQLPLTVFSDPSHSNTHTRDTQHALYGRHLCSRSREGARLPRKRVTSPHLLNAAILFCLQTSPPTFTFIPPTSDLQISIFFSPPRICHCYVHLAMDAAYFHSTLYAFNAEARDGVIKRVNARVQDVSVKCHYDGAQDVRLTSLI